MRFIIRFSWHSIFEADDFRIFTGFKIFLYLGRAVALLDAIEPFVAQHGLLIISWPTLSSAMTAVDEM